MIVMFNLRRYLTLFCKQNVHTILSPSTNHHLHHYLSLSSRHQFFIIFNFLWSLLTTVSRWLVTLQRFTYISHNLPSQIEYRRHQRHENHFRCMICFALHQCFSIQMIVHMQYWNFLKEKRSHEMTI